MSLEYSKVSSFDEFNLNKYINNGKYCVRLGKTNNSYLIYEANKLDMLLSYVEGVLFAFEDLKLSALTSFTLNKNKMALELSQEFCIPTKRQFEATVSTIKAELRDSFNIEDDGEQLTFFAI